MDREQTVVQFDEFVSNVTTIFDEMAAHGTGVVVERGGMLYAVQPKRRRARRARHFAPGDSLFDIVGIGRSGGPGDVSEHKHRYLADAAADLHEDTPRQDVP